MSNDTSSDTTITTDRTTIREWIEESGATPASRTVMVGEEETRRPYVHHPDHGTVEGVEETSWDEFFTTFEEDEMALIRRPGDEAHEYEVVSRTEAAERAALDDEEVEAALLGGETVRSTVTETRVIEREIVETIDIESEVVDAEAIYDTVLGSDLISREIVNTELSDDEIIEVDVDEMRQIEREIVERKTVESRIVDHDIEEFDTLESDTLEERIDMAGVERQILAGDLLSGPGETEDVTDVEMVESRISEDRTILSDLYERRLIRENVVDHKRFTYHIDEAELLDSEKMDSEVIETQLVSGEEIEFEGAADAESLAAESEMAEGGMAGDEMVEGGMADEGFGDDSKAESATASSGMTTGDGPITVDHESTGKHVVDASGERLGVVTEVDESMIYVDPNPSITERIRARLGWEGHDEDSLPIQQGRIAEVTAEEIRLADFDELDR